MILDFGIAADFVMPLDQLDNIAWADGDAIVFQDSKGYGVGYDAGVRQCRLPPIVAWERIEEAQSVARDFAKFMLDEG